jgi:D-alanine-D-alanine ligase
MEVRLGKIGVLMGGPSSEREISLRSGEAVLEALSAAGVQAAAIDIVTDSKDENISLIKSFNIDCAFIALHGHFGEDGQIQEVLEAIKIPYTGSAVLASRLAMDKVSSHNIFENGGLNVAKQVVLNKENYPDESRDYLSLGFPLVVKPVMQGSSIGLSIVEKEADLSKAVELAFKFDERVIIEEFLKGRELTVGILEDLPLPLIEIKPKRAFFDFQAKYQPGQTDYIVPAEIREDISRKVQEAALSAHRLLGCSGCSRVDIILNEESLPFVLELNSIPGLTNTSLLPKAAKCAGIGFAELCVKLINLAYEKTEAKFSS